MSLNIIQDKDGLSRIILSDKTGSSAEVLLDGGKVVSWKNQRKEELIFTSKVKPKQSKEVRGGISVCFPQFGNFGIVERHGFARNRLWTLDKDPSPLSPLDNQSSVDLILKSTTVDFKTWPHSFELRLRITLNANKLILIPRVRNIDNKPFSFTLSLNNYFSVSDISEVRVEGLETLDYFDNLLERTRFTEQGDAVTFDGQVDRVYLDAPSKVAIIDHGKRRTVVMQKNAMPDTAMWNPWDKQAKALHNIGNDEYKFMICVSSVATSETPIVLKPCEEWKGYQELSSVSSSYYSGQLDPREVLNGYSHSSS